MILELDAGNSRLKWRLRQADSYFGKDCKEPPETGVLASIEQLQQLAFGNQRPEQVLVASVRGDAWNTELTAWLRENWGLNPNMATVSRNCAGVTNHYPDCSKLGVDRWLAMLAAFHRANQACVVVDCGTALTVDVLGDDGEHQGGYIVPGLRIMRESLFANTRIQRFDETWSGTTAPGSDTISAINNGIMASLAGLISTSFHNHQQATSKQARLYLTGGDAQKFSVVLEAQVKPLEVVPDLVLDGLSLMFPSD